jgi:2-polyprenyl-3-methyl-5-hydroxy-6-metoxy-1,4-benzoquinol methylase
VPEKQESKFNADALSPEEIVALKESERRNRNIGAVGLKTSDFMAERGRFANTAEAQVYLKYLAPRPDQRVLDAGAGMGRFAVVVAPRVKRLVAVDLSSTALDVLVAETKVRNITNIETSQGDLCNIPESLGPFDSVYSVEAIQHIPSRKERLAAVRNLCRMLKPGGKCLVSVVGWNARVAREVEKEGFWGTDDGRLYAFCSTPEELQALMEEAGVRNVKIRGVIALPGRITRHLPLGLTCLETWCSAIPQLAPFSWFVMGIGER